MTNPVDINVEYIDVQGAQIQLLKGGQGNPLLYLHSAGGETFAMPFHEGLAAHFSLIAPVHPGFDQSGGTERINDIEDLAFYYRDFLDAMGIDKIDIVGTSLGGWIALELAVRWPERIGKLVLVDSVGIWLPDTPIAELFGLEPAEMRELAFYDPQSEVAQTLIMDDPPEDLTLLILKGLETTAKLGWNPYLHNPKLYNRLRHVKSPTMVLWGEQDKLVPVAYAHAFHKAIANSELVILPECGHMPIFEKMEEFVEHVVRFVKN